MHVTGLAGQELTFPWLRVVELEVPFSAGSHLHLLIGIETDTAQKNALNPVHYWVQVFQMVEVGVLWGVGCSVCVNECVCVLSVCVYEREIRAGKRAP